MTKIWNHDRLLVMSRALWESDASPEFVRQKFDQLGMTFYLPWEKFQQSFGTDDEWEKSIDFTNVLKKAMFSLVHGIPIWSGRSDVPSNYKLNNVLDFIKKNNATSPCQKNSYEFINENQKKYSEKFNTALNQARANKQIDKSILCNINASLSVDNMIQGCIREDLKDFNLFENEDRTWVYSKEITSEFSVGIYFNIKMSNFDGDNSFQIKHNAIIFKTKQKFNLKSEKGYFILPFFYLSPYSMVQPNFAHCTSISDIEYVVRVVLKCYKFVQEDVERSVALAFS